MNTENRFFRIICLKRSTWNELPRDGYISDWYATADLWYWRPNRAGYTRYSFDAGHYTLEEIADCAGSRGDWMLEPVWIKEPSVQEKITSFCGAGAPIA